MLHQSLLTTQMPAGPFSLLFLTVKFSFTLFHQQVKSLRLFPQRIKVSLTQPFDNQMNEWTLATLLLPCEECSGAQLEGRLTPAAFVRPEAKHRSDSAAPPEKEANSVSSSLTCCSCMPGPATLTKHFIYFPETVDTVQATSSPQTLFCAGSPTFLLRSNLRPHGNCKLATFWVFGELLHIYFVGGGFVFYFVQDWLVGFVAGAGKISETTACNFSSATASCWNLCSLQKSSWSPRRSLWGL